MVPLCSHRISGGGSPEARQFRFSIPPRSTVCGTGRIVKLGGPVNIFDNEASNN